jgi:hypothetical protein
VKGVFRASVVAVVLGLTVVGCRVSVMPTPTPPVPSGSPDKLTHQFPELEQQLPATLAGVPARSRESYDGVAAADDETLYFGIYPRLIDAVGAEHADRIHIADEAWSIRRGWLSLRVFRLETAEPVWPAVMDSALAASESSSNRWQRATVEDRQVLSALDLPPESRAIYVIARGDTIYEVVSPDRETAAAIVAALP